MQQVPRTLLLDTTGDIAAAAAAAVTEAVAAVTANFRGHISGLTLSVAGGTNTFNVASGVAVNSTATTLMTLPTAIAKNGGAAWSVGTAGGSLDTGALAANTWYHVHLIKRLDTGVVDVLISLSATAPTLPANYTVFRRIGSMKTTAGSVWQTFYQYGDDFLWDTPITDANGVNPAAGIGITLSVPSGAYVTADIGAALASTTIDTNIAIHSTLVANQSAGVPTANYAIFILVAGKPQATRLRLGAFSGTIRATSGGAGTHTFYVVTHGWTDRRGKD
jgi:hypothetical protein